MFVLAAGGTVAFVAVQSDRDARERALNDAAFAAGASAKQLGIYVDTLKKTTAQLAANPQIDQIFARPEGCSLTFSGIGGADQGHLDIVAADGTVLCSSREAPSGSPGAPYRGNAWLDSALARKTFLSFVIDEATGSPVALSAEPIAGGRGVVVAFGDLAAVGPALAASYGGGRPSEFLVTSRDGRTVLARSLEPGRWVGKPLPARVLSEINESERRDLDGVVRFYERSSVPGVGWQFHVGEKKVAALALQERLEKRQLVIVLAGLLISLLAAWFIYRSVVAPIRRLSGALEATNGEARLVPVPAAGPVEVIALAQEINDLLTSVDREFAERLESEARYRDLFENATDLIAVLDLDGRVVNINAAFARALGRPSSELIGNSMPELLPPTWNAEQALANPAAFESGQAVSVYERELHASEAQAIVVEIAGRVIEEKNQAVGFEAICRDITERRVLEEQLRQAQRLESVGRLAGGVAHDFNNLLTVISGYAELLLAQRNAADQSQLQQIAAAAERATSLTRQLLAFSRQQVLQPRPVDLNGVVRGLVPMLSQLIGEDIEVIVNLAPTVHTVVADPTQLEQVIMNLVVNARDAMPDGGTLSIQTANTTLDQSYLDRHPEAQLGANVMLTVTDTGNGMDAETLARAFEPFFSTKPIGAGTGLGLATIHGIVKQSRGSIWAYSEPNLGTTFKVYLPACTEVASDDPESGPTASGKGGTETILVAEDEAILRPLIAQMLENHGYETIVADSPQEAIEIVEREGDRISLLLTDLIMPQMTGRELAERIREHRETIEVVFMSGYAGDTVTRSGALEVDAAFLEKPFSSDELARTIRETLDQTRALT